MNTTNTMKSTGDPVYDTIFALLRTALWGEDRFPLSLPSDAVPDRDLVYQELCYQTVQNLPLDLLCRADSANKKTYLQSAIPRLSHYDRILKMQQKLYHLFQEAGISCVILKGTAAAVYYPNPSYRCMGDVDILVRPDDYAAAFSLLCQNGFSTDGAEDERHSHFKHNGILYELHRSFASFDNKEQSQALDRMLYEGILHAQTVSLNGQTFPTLPADKNGLVLLTHICQHLEGGIGLRQIIDWMMYADQILCDSFWDSTFQPYASALGLETLAVTVTKMCQLYLGLRKDLTWCSHGDEALCEELMMTILAGGNWGRKHGAHAQKSMATLIAAKNPADFFCYLQKRGCSNWKLLDSYPVLKPFAWLYQLCRYVRLGFSGEHSLLHFISNLKRLQKTDSLLDRLGLTQVSR